MSAPSPRRRWRGTGRRRRPRPGTLVALVALALLAVVAACSTPPPRASNAVPPPASPAPEPPIVWVALGGDETATTGPAEEAAAAWPQRVLARLPATAQLVNVATPGASVRTGLTTQLGALEANGVRPTVATVWFELDRRGAAPSQQRADLTTLVERLRSLGATEVVLLADADPADGSLTRDVATATGATYVPLTTVGRDATAPSAQRAIADAVAPVLAP